MLSFKPPHRSFAPMLAAAAAAIAAVAIPLPAGATVNFAFYDGDRLPIDALAYYDEVLVDPGKVTDGEITSLKQRGRQPMARVVPGAAKEKGAALLATLEKRGFVGFAFDARKPEHATAAEELLLEARRRAPAARIYYWGALDRLPSVAAAVSGFITDGVFTAGVAQAGEDTAPEVLDDMEGVRRMANLVDVRGKYKFPFVVIERVPNHQREQARGIARTLAERGFVPWVQVGGQHAGRGAEGVDPPAHPGPVRRRGGSRPAVHHGPPAGDGAPGTPGLRRRLPRREQRPSARRRPVGPLRRHRQLVLRRRDGQAPGL